MGRFFRQRFLGHRFPIGHRQAELRKNFLVRDRLIMLEPFVGLGDGFAFGLAEGVSVLRIDGHCVTFPVYFQIRYF